MSTEDKLARIEPVLAYQALPAHRGVGRRLRDSFAARRTPPGTNTLFLPYLALIIAVLALATSGIFVKWANVPGPVFGLYRMAIAVTLCSTLFSREIKRSAALPPRQIWLAVVAGVFLGMDLWLWNDAVLATSVANASLFGNTSVIWVTLGAMVLFKERLRPVFWGGLALALIGITVILGQDFLADPRLGLGDLMAIMAGFFYGGFFLATARARARLNAFVAWWVSSMTCGLVLLVVSLGLRQPLLGYSLQAYACMVAVAVLCQVGGYLAVNYALGHLPASLVSLTMLAQPVVTALLGIALLGQAIGFAQVIGGVAVLAGVIIVHRTRQTP